MTTLFREEMGAELRRIRRAKGLGLADVSSIAHVSTGHLSEIERGKNEASSEVLAAICEALGTSIMVRLEQLDR